ncbi:FAD-binding oxidoreductase [Skermanella mucosa]|nr:FAD-dependent oxidoreductase [Skermanella mucosa]UEM18863.1 FAD-binding oxidoreductase [Skermanella mucosa]
MSADRIECVVIGSGTLGAAVARRLALDGREVMLIARRDRQQDDGGHALAAGGWPEPVEAPVVDRPRTLRARFSALGAKALVSYCARQEVPFRRTGQLLIARDDVEMALLEDMKQRDPSVELLSVADVTAHERGLRCIGGLFAPDAGIVDGDALRLALRIEAENAGAFVTEDCRLVAAYPMRRGFEVDLGGMPGELETVRCDSLINATEDYEAVQIAARVEGMRNHVPPELSGPGSKRYKLEGTAPFDRLVVPGCRGAKSAALFFSGFLGESWMDVLSEPRDLVGRDNDDQDTEDPRPDDFRIQGQAEHGIPGLINLFGVDARSETRAALALADGVLDTLSGRVHLSELRSAPPSSLAVA